MTLCLTLATSTGQPVARAEARDLLASAIANTQGSYLVYNFGGGHPAPMLNAGGSWYDGEQRWPPDDHQRCLATAFTASAGGQPSRFPGTL